MPKYAFEQYIAVRRYQPALAFSPDGSEIAYITNTSGQYNLWKQPSAGGYAVQLTLFADQAVCDISWSPDGTTIAFSADRDGNEFKQIYTLPARGGLPELLTPAEGVRHELSADAWSPDGTSLAYGGNDRSESDVDILIRNQATGESRRVVDYGGYYIPVAWSPDGESMTLVDFRSNTDMDVYTLSVKDEEMVLQTAHEGEAVFIPGSWAPDSSGFYLITSEGREYSGLAFQKTDGTRNWVETPEADIENVELSRDGRYLVWQVNEQGYARLHGRDLSTGEMLDLPAIPDGTINSMAISPTGARIGLLLTQPRQSTEVVVIDIETRAVTTLTWSFLGGIEPTDLVAPQLITFPTHDGRDIAAWLYRPEGDGPFPVVLSIHGGPEAQERPNYSPLYQYLLSRGIGVMAPNVRGSTGYGKTFQTLIHHDWGGAELLDFKAAAEYLKALDWVDGNRLGVYGGSFGGFATLSCVTRLPEYWAAAVDIVGPSNLVTFAKAVPPTWRRFMDKWVGNPETEVDFLMERSPITYVDQVRAPLFVIQGANDPRVVKGESDQIVERLQERGVEVRYDVYEDEGHGFTRRANEIKAMGDAAQWFIDHLGATA